MTNAPILATTITLVFDVSAAPICTPLHYGPMFPKTLRVQVYDGGQVSVHLEAFKARKNGTESVIRVSPYILIDDRKALPWIVECIQTALAYAAYANEAR